MSADRRVGSPTSGVASADRAAAARSDWLWGGLLVLLTIAAYGPAYRAGFVWDDDANVTANSVLRGLSGLADIWFYPGATTQYYPLVYTSFWLEHAAWGLAPLGYHVDNVLLHAGSALLAWRILRHLEVPGAWLAAAIFALHPVHVESVAWVTERKNVLSGAFYLGSAFFYLRDVSGLVDDPTPARRLRGAVLTYALYLAALLSKPVTASLPAALLLVAWWKRGRIVPADVLRLAPMLVLALPVALLTVSLETVVGDHLVFDWSPTPAERILLLGRALWFYAGKLALPIDLSFVYPRFDLDPAVAWQWAFPIAALVVVAGLWAGRRRLGRGPLVAVLYFAGTLVPALGFIEVYFFKFSYVADHWQYLASLGLISLAAAGGVTAVGRVGLGRGVGSIIAAGLLAAGLVLTWQQAGIYRDIETLWRDTLRKNPESALARYNLAHHLAQTDRPDAARREFRETLRLDPDHAAAHNNLGFLQLLAGEREAAMRSFRRTLVLEPDNMLAHWNLGRALEAEGRTDEAFEHYEAGLAFTPRTREELHELAAGHEQLGRMWARRGHLDDAIRNYRAALAIEPADAAAQRRLGVALMRAGRIPAARKHLELAVRLDPTDALARKRLDEVRSRAARAGGSKRGGR